jgi:branched-chain amino acid transport system substrate-binding protein
VYAPLRSRHRPGKNSRKHAPVGPSTAKNREPPRRPPLLPWLSRLAYTYTYPTPPLVRYPEVSYGPNTAQFVAAYHAAYHKAPNFLDTAGYNAGLIIQDMLDHATKFTQLGFHAALMRMSGKTTTLLGRFQINANGAQLGELLPVAQLVPERGQNKVVVVYPEDKATGKPVYPAPKS